MGREIRKVTPDWHHPKDYKGHHKPLYDRNFEVWAKMWMDDLQEWIEEYPSGFQKTESGNWAFWEWRDGPSPERDMCRPSWTVEEATAYQIYENVTEGTPVSPVFETEDAMRAWLLSEWELSEQAADHFIKAKYSPSMIMSSAGITKPGADTIEAMAQLDKGEE